MLLRNSDIDKYQTTMKQLTNKIRKQLLKYIEVPLDIKEQDTSSSLGAFYNNPKISSVKTRKRSFKYNSMTHQIHQFSLQLIRMSSDNCQQNNRKPSLRSSCTNETDSNSSPDISIKNIGKKLLEKISPYSRVIDALNYLKAVSSIQESSNYVLKSSYENSLITKDDKKKTEINIMNFIKRMRIQEMNLKNEEQKSSQKKRSIFSNVNSTKTRKRKPIDRKFTDPGNESFKLAMERLVFEPLYY